MRIGTGDLSALVFAAGLSVGLCDVSSAETKRLPPPPPDIAALTLPTGKLLPISIGTSGAVFLDMNRTRKTGALVDLWTFTALRPGIETDYGLAVQTVWHGVLDCTRRTRSQSGLQAFDASNRLVMWLPAEKPEPLRLDSGGAFLAEVVCDGARAPTAPVVGHAEAFALGKGELERRR